MKKFLILLSLLFLCSPAWAAIALVQTKGLICAAPAVTCSATFTSNVTAGSLIVVQEYAYASTTIGLASDTINGNYTVVSGVGCSGSFCFATYYFYNSAAGSDTVTTVRANTTSSIQMVISEFSGVMSASDPLDVYDLMGTGTSTTPTSDSVTLSTSGLVVSMATYNSSSKALTKGAAYSDLVIVDTLPFGTEYKTTTAGATTADWSINTSKAYYVNIVAFKEPAGVVANTTNFFHAD